MRAQPSSLCNLAPTILTPYTACFFLGCLFGRLFFVGWFVHLRLLGELVLAVFDFGYGSHRR
ncbi:hypothetical protein, partial [Pseudomonas sp. SIMBA_044]|uniref:hypothetical protein n=1 Tax=Pseudomonas sp. SIMBA_044 TaxID=3085785 RepID=UPI00397ADB1B